MPESALIVEVQDFGPLVERWRSTHCPLAARGVPAHITIIYPFRPPDTIGPETLDALSSITATSPAFEFSLVDVRSFPDAVWLCPEPTASFEELTAECVKAFPDCPPYGGLFTVSIPHLTIADCAAGEAEVLLARARSAFAEVLPLEREARLLSLFTSDDQGVWSRHRSFPLAGRAHVR